MIRGFAGLLFIASLAAHAQSDFVIPPPALVLDGVPPIPNDIVEKVRPYGEFRPHALMSWHPTKREMLVRRRLNATNQVHLVSQPGLPPYPLTDLADAVNDAEFRPTDGESFVFIKGEGGNETFRVYRYDFETRDISALSESGSRASEPRWNRQGTRIVFTTRPVDRNNPQRIMKTAVHLMDPAHPETDRVLATLDNFGWDDFRFSEDGKRLAFVEYISANESHLWVMDVATGKKRRVTKPGKAEPISYRAPLFSRDGRGLFALSDRGSEFHRLVYIPLNGGAERPLTTRIKHDVDDFDISFDADRIAFTTNEDGSSVLRFLDLKTLKELPRPPLVHGVITGLEWRRHSTEVGFSITSARSAGDVFSYDIRTNQLTRWTNGNNPEVNTRAFAEPRLIRWKSFDGREISGFLYQPPESFTGKRPVIVNIHGGPESEFRPGFIARNNYLITELGIAMIYPNVRGSAGFGKTFLKLDNGMKREDSVKDIGALLDWIKEQPDLDAGHVMIIGGSYGGYMTLACAFHFADRIAGAASMVGISNFVTFLERTETYRRDLRRVEYGDERIPGMRAFLESIAPVNNADKITKPLLVGAGLNDPRVPYTEAVQIVDSMKKRERAVWFILAKDEGHGFQKKPNADFYFYATVEFAKQTLLDTRQP